MPKERGSKGEGYLGHVAESGRALGNTGESSVTYPQWTCPKDSNS